jgi:HEAT repeat protein
MVMCVFDKYRRRKAVEKARAKMDALERARDVAGLAEQLHGSQRVRAAAALHRIGGREAVEALLAALDGASTSTRRAIVWSLGMIGDPIVTDTLIGLLDDSQLADEAATALALIGGREVVEALLAALAGASAETGRWIVTTLGKIGHPIGRRALEAVAGALTDPAFPGSRAPLGDAVRALLPDLRRPSSLPGHLTRHAAAEVRRLLWAGDLDAAGTLLVQVRDGLSSVEVTAAGARWGGASLARAAAESALTTVSLLEALANHSVGPSAMRITELIELHSLTPWVELNHLEAFLATLPEDLEQAVPSSPVDAQVDEPTIEVMIRLLRGSDDDSAALRRDTLIFLHRMNRLDSVEDLGTTLNDGHWLVRLAAVAALRKVTDPEAIAALRTRMDDENPEIRRTAVAVAITKDGQVLRQAVRDPHDEVRAQAAISAADLDDPRWADVLAPLLTDADPLARVHAGEALHRWAWTGEPIQAAISAGAWDDVVAAGAAAARPLMRMFEATYRDHDPDKEPAMRALERLVTAHGSGIPDDVLRAGADFEDFRGVLRDVRDSDAKWAPNVDASGLRQACREALWACDSGPQSTAD